MKYLLLTLALLCTSCAQLSGVTKDASGEIRKAAGQLEATVKSIRSEIQPYANTAVALCADSDSDVCQGLSDSASALETALQAAEKAIQGYRAGEVLLSDAYILVRRALDQAEVYAREVLALHARSNA